MIIKSHIRGGFRDAATYLKEQGQNELTRLVEISDPHAKGLDEAFRAMWAISANTKVKKPLHHVSINPMKDERLNDKQVKQICERLEEKYGYARGEHQRVIVEHIKDGRQHFHVIWNRVNLRTGKPHYPYMHKKQSKIAAREMEIELGLKKIPYRRAVNPRNEERFIKKRALKHSSARFPRLRHSQNEPKIGEKTVIIKRTLSEVTKPNSVDSKISYVFKSHRANITSSSCRRGGTSSVRKSPRLAAEHSAQWCELGSRFATKRMAAFNEPNEKKREAMLVEIERQETIERALLEAEQASETVAEIVAQYEIIRKGSQSFTSP